MYLRHRKENVFSVPKSSGMGWNKFGAVGALAAVLASTIGFAAHAQWDPNPVGGFSTATDYHGCSAQDYPEKGIQGDVGDPADNAAYGGFNCNLSFVGHTTLDAVDPTDGYKRSATGNANMAWSGNCAYVSGPSSAVAPDAPATAPAKGGVAVVDVSDPQHPKHVHTLHASGSAATSETIAAIDATNGHSILVVGQYGNTAVDSEPTTTNADPLGNKKPMDIYDVTGRNCAAPKLLAHFDWPLNIHNLTITKDGKYVIATQPLQVLDISHLFDKPAGAPVWLGNLDKAMDGPLFAVGPSADVTHAAGVTPPTHPSYTSHEAYALQTIDQRGATHTKLYLGGQLPTFELMTIVDITDWLQRDAGGQPKRAPQIISQESGRGHSVRLADINHVPYLLHSEESPFGAGFSCAPKTTNPFAGPAQPWLTNIHDESNPVLVSQMGLAVNEPQNCPTQLQRKETNSVHYHDVDDPNDTQLVFASMWNSGIRVFDVNDPVHPTEVAYFNPGDADPSPTGTTLDHVWGHIRYMPKTGQVWFASADGGFWVVELTGHAREIPHTQPKTAPLHKNGLPGWNRASNVAVRLNVPVTAAIDVTPYYCTLGTVQGLNSPLH